jgi:hypothetical protein
VTKSSDELDNEDNDLKQLPEGKLEDILVSLENHQMPYAAPVQPFYGHQLLRRNSTEMAQAH